MHLRSLGVLLLLGLIWGASFLFIKVGVAEIPPATLVAVRLIIAVIILLIVLYSAGLRLPSSLRAWGDLAFVGIVGVVLPFLLITWGEQSIASSMAAILNATTPLFTMLLASVWTREDRMAGQRWVGVVIGFVGVIVAVGTGGLTFDSGLLGKLAVLMAAVCYAVTAIFSRRAFRGMPALVPATGQILFGTLVITPVALVLDGVPRALPSAAAIGAVLALAILGTALAYLMYYWLLDRLGAPRTSMVTYLTPPLALVYGALLLSEPITLNALLGLGLVIAGIALANSVIRLRPARPGVTP